MAGRFLILKSVNLLHGELNNYMMKKMLLITALMFCVSAHGQELSDSIEYMGMRMTIEEKDTLQNKLEKDCLPAFIYYFSSRPAFAFNSPYSRNPIDIPLGLKIYVLRKAENDAYLCETANRMLFIYRSDIELDDKMDSILSIHSAIYQHFRIQMSTMGLMTEYVSSLKKLETYYTRVLRLAKQRKECKMPDDVARLLNLDKVFSSFMKTTP